MDNNAEYAVRRNSRLLSLQKRYHRYGQYTGTENDHQSDQRKEPSHLARRSTSRFPHLLSARFHLAYDRRDLRPTRLLKLCFPNIAR